MRMFTVALNIVEKNEQQFICVAVGGTIFGYIYMTVCIYALRVM